MVIKSIDHNHMSKAFWEEFFRDAGIPPHHAASYAAVFEDNRFVSKSLLCANAVALPFSLSCVSMPPEWVQQCSVSFQSKFFKISVSMLLVM